MIINTQSEIWENKIASQYDYLIKKEAGRRGYKYWLQWPQNNFEQFWSFSEKTLGELGRKYEGEILKEIHLNKIKRTGSCFICVGKCKYT